MSKEKKTEDYNADVDNVQETTTESVSETSDALDEPKKKNNGMVIAKKSNKKVIAILITAVVVLALVVTYFIISVVNPRFFKHMFDSNYVIKFSYDNKHVEINDEKYAYWFNAQKSQYDSGNDAYWDDPNNATTFKAIKDYAEYACKLYTVPYILAERANYTLTDEDKAEIDKTLQENIKEAGGQAKFDALLNTNKISLDTYKYFLTSDHLKSVMLQKYKEAHPISDADIQKYYDENYVVVKHILISNDSVKDKTDDIVKITNSVYDQAIAGTETFEQLIDKYNTDPGMKANPEGYFVTKDGSYVEAFQNASLALKIGEISKPVETNYGYHIIKRYDPTEFYSKNKTALNDQYYSKEFSTELQSVMNELDKTTKYANYYSKMKADQFNKK